MEFSAKGEQVPGPQHIGDVVPIVAAENSSAQQRGPARFFAGDIAAFLMAAEPGDDLRVAVKVEFNAAAQVDCQCPPIGDRVDRA